MNIRVVYWGEEEIIWCSRCVECGVEKWVGIKLVWFLGLGKC